MSARGLAIVLLMLALAGEAQAASAAQVRRDCTADALRYCAWSIARGRAAIIRCMVAHRAQLSPRCKAHLR